MKKLLCLLLLCCSIYGWAQETDALPFYHNDFSTGSYQYLFADKVKLRKQASTDAEVLAILPMNTMIKILGKTEETMDFDGIQSPWYQVAYDGKIGYVLGALIALDRVRSQKTFTDFLVQLKGEVDEYYIKIRTTTDNENYEETVFPLLNPDFDIELLSGKTLEGVQNILKIRYISEACGVEGGYTYIVWSDETLQLLADLTDLGDAGIFYVKEELIFPTDEEGIENTLQYRYHRTTYEDESIAWKKTTEVQRNFTWELGKTATEIHAFQKVARN